MLMRIFLNAQQMDISWEWSNVSKGEQPDLFASKPDFSVVFALKSMFEGVLVSGWGCFYSLLTPVCASSPREAGKKFKRKYLHSGL